ncbi:hypothetical protein HZB01_05515 [Candidatus Woesearchaeota archaeon]|nr:hypothetical protein [Candidatus Woesearchaeota archaeon]
MTAVYSSGIHHIIKFKGVFDLAMLYKVAQKWFAKRGYEFHETLFRDKQESMGRELTIEWDGWKRYTMYLKYIVRVRFKIWHVNEVEVVQNGEKRRMIRGRMRIIITGEVEADYSRRFEVSPFAKALQKFHDTYLFKKELDHLYADQMHYIQYKLGLVIKKFLNMGAYTEQSDDIW